MTFTLVLNVQARRKKKEEAANTKIMEAEKRNKVSKSCLFPGFISVVVLKVYYEYRRLLLVSNCLKSAC